MVGYAKNAPKGEEWLGKKIELLYIQWKENDTTIKLDDLDDFTRTECNSFAKEILAKMEEGGWVSPADLKEALSRELAAGFRLGLNKSKEVNDD